MDMLDIFRSIIDIAIVGYIIYKIIMVVQGTKAVQILKGTAVVLFVWILSGILGLETLTFILSQVIIYGILGLMIIFQPELRKALESLGRKNLFGKTVVKDISLEDKIIKDMVESVDYMSKRRIGALISFEFKNPLDEFIKTGISLRSDISKELLINIFTPNVPLHDGAVIIKEGKIMAASCYLPLSESKSISKELGTRHRAAIGLSEETDALTVVISEETGTISITKNSKIYRGLNLDELKNHLEILLGSKEEEKTPWLRRRLF